MPPAGHEVVLITRQGCHLCHEAESVLRRMARELGFDYRELDVDADARRRAEYSDRVPVVLVDGREHGYWRVEEDRLRRALVDGPQAGRGWRWGGRREGHRGRPAS